MSLSVSAVWGEAGWGTAACPPTTQPSPSLPTSCGPAMLGGEPTHEMLTAPAGPGGSAGRIVSRAPASWTAVTAAALPTRSGASDYFSTCGRNRRKLKSHGELASQRLSTQRGVLEGTATAGGGGGGVEVGRGRGRRWHMAP